MLRYTYLAPGAKNKNKPILRSHESLFIRLMSIVLLFCIYSTKTGRSLSPIFQNNEFMAFFNIKEGTYSFMEGTS